MERSNDIDRHELIRFVQLLCFGLSGYKPSQRRFLRIKDIVKILRSFNQQI